MVSPELSPLTLPRRARRELGFDEVEAFLREHCRTPFGLDALDVDPFPAARAHLEARLQDSMEGRALAERSVHPDFAGVRDLRPLLELVEKEGVLGPKDLLDIARTLDAVGRIRDLVVSRTEEFPRLSALALALHDERDLSRRIARSFDDQGNLVDEASPALRELRERVRALRVDAKSILEDLIREMDDQGLLRDRNFTLRHDRYVLPVRAEHQSVVDGLVHDASQTGQTVFIEPRAVMKVGNRIMIAESAVREEERRILVELSHVVARHRGAILDDLGRVGALEAAFVRGLFAALTDGKLPHLVGADEGAALRLDDARHPLLALRAGQSAREGRSPPPVIANDIRFDGRRALVISGPNAGGKTVALKTAGLVAVLARAGIPVSCATSSKVPLFSAILATIGDEQSIADDLSSFSGHLEALAGIHDAVKGGGGGALVLLDEICAGTDPNQGAALAQAFLEDLVNLGAVVVATTHYERLKVLAIAEESRDRFRNASFALDARSGRPTFSLHLDSVGTSNALDAARRHHVDDAIIARATALLDPTAREVQSLLDELAAKNAALDARLRALDEDRADIAAQNEKLRQRLAEVHDEAQRLRREGARAFLDEMREARRKVALAIEAVQRGADARTLNEISHGLRDEVARLEQATQSPRADIELAPVADVRPGMVVEVAGMPGVRFDVIAVNGDDVELQAGAMRTKKKRADLRRAGEGARERSSSPPRGASPSSSSSGDEPRTSENTLDLRGTRVEDALERLDAFLDTRMREGRSRVYVLHGHGTGALKKAIRDAVRTSRYVARSRAAEREEGGDAITVLELADGAPAS